MKKIEIYKNRFCFYGAWNRLENTEALKWFLKNVYPKLSGNFEFVIIGGGMTPSLKRKISLYKCFKYIGFVNDPVKEIAQCQALIAPLHKGAGVKVKVIDSLSSGTCVIGTDVAFEGIEDNLFHKLFFRVTTADGFCAIINNWRTIETNEKQAAADEFYDRYNKNHFPDLLGC